VSLGRHRCVRAGVARRVAVRPDQAVLPCRWPFGCSGLPPRCARRRGGRGCLLDAL